MRWAYCARVLTEVARQTAGSILDGKGSAVLHVCAGLSRIIFVVKHCEKETKNGKILCLKRRHFTWTALQKCYFTADVQDCICDNYSWTYSMQCLRWSSERRAPTGWRNLCQTPQWRAEEVYPGLSHRNTGPGQKKKEHVYDYQPTNSVLKACGDLLVFKNPPVSKSNWANT